MQHQILEKYWQNMQKPQCFCIFCQKVHFRGSAYFPNISRLGPRLRAYFLHIPNLWAGVLGSVSQYWLAYFTNLCGLPQYFPDVFPIVYQYFPDMSSWCNLLPKRLGKCAAPNIGKILAKYAETPVFFAYFAKRFISAGLHIFPIFLGSVPACLHIFCIFSQSLGRRIGNCFPILACMFYPSLWAAPIFSRCFPNSLPIFS